MIRASTARCASIALLGIAGLAQAAAIARYDGPIIDVHLHTDPPGNDQGAPNPATGTPAVRSAAELRDRTLEEARKHNIVRMVLSGWPGTLEPWIAADPGRIIAALMVLKSAGQFEMSADALRTALEARPGSVIGELTTQYIGWRPDDRAVRFFRLAGRAP